VLYQRNIHGYIYSLAMDLSVDISMDIHIHGKPGSHSVLLPAIWHKRTHRT